jgi:Fe-S-cluster containining protein
MFARILGEKPGISQPFERLAGCAFELFEANVTLQVQSLPPLACKKGCPSCCVLRVAATAPEIFLLADYVQRIDAATAAIGLARRVALADRATRGLNETDRMALGKPCPFLVRGVCIVHPVRPLACRGHASFDRQACARAAAGKDVEVPLSEPHAALRGFVQSALQSALRTGGLVWGLYEMNHGLVLALDRKARDTNWLAGGDSLAQAALELDWTAEAERYDALLGS